MVTRRLIAGRSEPRVIVGRRDVEVGSCRRPTVLFASWMAARSVQTPAPTSQILSRPASAASPVLLTVNVRACARPAARTHRSASAPTRALGLLGLGLFRSPAARPGRDRLPNMGPPRQPSPLIPPGDGRTPRVPAAAITGQEAARCRGSRARLIVALPDMRLSWLHQEQTPGQEAAWPRRRRAPPGQIARNRYLAARSEHGCSSLG